MEDDSTSKTFTPEDISKLLREHKESNNFASTTAQAVSFKCSSAYLYAVYAGDKPPGPAILEALGLEKQVVYKTKRWR